MSSVVNLRLLTESIRSLSRMLEVIFSSFSDVYVMTHTVCRPTIFPILKTTLMKK